MSNETLRNVGEYVARFEKQIKQASSEDRQKAYEQGIDFITDWMLARNIEENRKENNQNIIETRKEQERIEKKQARLNLIKSLNLNSETGRIDFCIHYLGCETRGIDNKGLDISSVPRDSKKVKEAYKMQKGKAIKARGLSSGNQILKPAALCKYEETMFIISAPQDVLKNVIAKHNLSSPALTIDYANGNKGGVWQSSIGGMSNRNLSYQIDGLTVSHDLILNPDDKLTMDVSKLDDDAKLTGLNNVFVSLLKETMGASDKVKRAMMF